MASLGRCACVVFAAILAHAPLAAQRTSTPPAGGARSGPMPSRVSPARAVTAVRHVIALYLKDEARGDSQHLVVIDSTSLRDSIPLTDAQILALRDQLPPRVAIGLPALLPLCNQGETGSCEVMAIHSYSERGAIVHVYVSWRWYRGCGSHGKQYRLRFQGDAVVSTTVPEEDWGDCGRRTSPPPRPAIDTTRSARQGDGLLRAPVRVRPPGGISGLR